METKNNGKAIRGTNPKYPKHPIPFPPQLSADTKIDRLIKKHIIDTIKVEKIGLSNFLLQ